MKISLETPSTLAIAQRHDLNTLAAAGFGFDKPEDMFDDTMRHIEASDIIQTAHADEELVGLAFYRRSLWRQGC